MPFAELYPNILFCELMKPHLHKGGMIIFHPPILHFQPPETSENLFPRVAGLSDIGVGRWDRELERKRETLKIATFLLYKQGFVHSWKKTLGYYNPLWEGKAEVSTFGMPFQICGKLLLT